MGSSHVLITGGSVIDGDGTAAQADTDVLISDDEIAALGPSAAEQAGQLVGVDVIDASGCWVMPGLIDSHVHATFGEPVSNDELFFHRDPTTAALVTAHNLPKMLLAGVTSFFDPDTLFQMGPSVRNAVAAGVIEGPRIATGVSALLTAVGGTAGRLIPDEGGIGYAEIVRTSDEMVIATRNHIKMGADWIKIHATGSIPTRSGELEVWTLDEMRVVCDTAHDLGVPVAAHCRSASSARDAAVAGVDLILHASFLDDDGLEAIVESGASICPTFTFLANLCDHGDKVGAGVGMIDIFRGEIEATAAKMREAHDAGVRLLCGSESGFVITPYGHWHARELQVFVEELGLSPLEAIRCGTVNGATAMRMEGQIGRVAVGQLADVLVLAADPSSDITVLADRSNIRSVISKGAAVDLDRPWPSRDPLPGERVGAWATQPLTWDLVNP
jgi:imidazolonepropionase-like amidohydrolase